MLRRMLELLLVLAVLGGLMGGCFKVDTEEGTIRPGNVEIETGD